MKRLGGLIVGVLCASGMLMGTSYASEKQYDVTITNLTRSEIFTPILVATHNPRKKMFMLGSGASDELAAMAEGGDTSGLSDILMPHDSATSGPPPEGLLLPGESVTLRVSAKEKNRISVAAMLIPSNDAFFAVNGIKLPKHAMTIMSPAYDAGSEPNDELCANIPGPACGGDGGSPGVGGEGYVHIHAGIHGIGDLAAAEYDWRNPVAKITIKRVRK